MFFKIGKIVSRLDGVAEAFESIGDEQIKQQQLNREQRVSDALKAAKLLKEDKEGLNLVQPRQTLKQVKMMWVRARSTNLTAINGSLGDGSDANLDLRTAMQRARKRFRISKREKGYTQYPASNQDCH